METCLRKACEHAFDKKSTNHWMPSTELYWKCGFTKKNLLIIDYSSLRGRVVYNSVNFDWRKLGREWIPDCAVRCSGLLAVSRKRNPPVRPASERMRCSLTISKASWLLKDLQSQIFSISATHDDIWWANTWSNILLKIRYINYMHDRAVVTQYQWIRYALQKGFRNDPTFHEVSSNRCYLARQSHVRRSSAKSGNLTSECNARGTDPVNHKKDQQWEEKAGIHLCDQNAGIRGMCTSWNLFLCNDFIQLLKQKMPCDHPVKVSLCRDCTTATWCKLRNVCIKMANLKLKG